MNKQKEKEDGRTRYNKIRSMLKDIVGQRIHINRLWRRVMIDIGSSEKVIRDCIYLMINLGMIREVDDNVYLIVSDKANI